MISTRVTVASLALVLSACTVTKTEYVFEDTVTSNDPTDPSNPTDPNDGNGNGNGNNGTDGDVDSDGDGLTDAEEAEFGTDPDAADSDGDGFDDGDEVDAGTNPANEYSHTYDGGYNVGYCEDGTPTATGPTGPPGSSGFPKYQGGDVAENFSLLDQYGEYVDLYSFCGQVVQLTFSAMWCGPCQHEAMLMQGHQDQYWDDGYQTIEILIENYNYGGGLVDQGDLESWANSFGLDTVPVLADPVASYTAWPFYEMDWGIPTTVFIDRDMSILAVDIWGASPSDYL